MSECVSIRQPLWKLSREAAPNGKGEKEDIGVRRVVWVWGGSWWKWMGGDSEVMSPVILSSFV